MAQSLASDSLHPAGKLPPTLTPTGHFAGKPTLPISRSVTLIGSRKQARLQLISSTVSQNHALIINADSGPYIRDLASREHVLVNGIEVTEGALEDGDEITIGRFTFRFNASPHTRPSGDVRGIKPAPAAKLEVEGSDLPVPFDGKAILIGRRDGCDVKLLEDSVSTTHAIIFEMDGRRYIRDLASRTGTFVNDKQVRQVEIMPGDQVKCGQTEMRYIADGVPAAARGFARPAAARPAAPAELGAKVDDLAQAEAPRTTAAAAAAAAGPAGTEKLELVQDEAAEVEPAEINAPGLELEPLGTADAEAGFAELDVEVEPEPDADAVAQADAGASAPPPAEFAPLPISEAPAPVDIDDDERLEPLDEDDLLAELAPTAPIAREERRPSVTPPAVTEHGTEHGDDDDIVDLASVVEVEADALAAVAAPAPAPEPEPVPAAEATEDLLDRVDLDANGEVSGPGETAGIAVEPEEPAQAPTLSEQLVETPEEPAEIEIAQDALTASADRASDEAGEAVEAGEAGDAGAAGTAQDEFLPIEIADEDGEIDLGTEVTEPEAFAPEPSPTPEPEQEREPAQAEAANTAPAQAEIDAADELAFASEEETVEAAPAAAAPIDEFAPAETGEPADAGAAIDFEAADRAALEEAAPAAEATEPAVTDEPQEFAPLGLESEQPATEATVESPPAFDDAAAMEALGLGTDAPEDIAAAGAAAGAGAIAATGADAIADAADVADAAEPTVEEAPKKKSRRRKKKTAEPPPETIAGEATDEVAADEALALETPAPEPPAPPPPSRVAPPGVSQWQLSPVADDELIAPTEATPESALSLDEAVAAGEAAAADRLHEVELTDSTFGRAVDDFTGSATGPIIESPAGEADPELRPQASSEPVALEAIETVDLAQDDSMPSAAAMEEYAHARGAATEDETRAAGVVEDDADAAAPQEIEELPPQPIGEEADLSARVAQRDEPRPAIDDEAALDLLAADDIGQHDSPGLTLDEDRALRAPEPPPSPLLPAAASAERAVPSELSPPETGAADDRLFDFDLEPVPGDGSNEINPHFSVHPEDLDERAASAERAAAEAEAEVEEVDVFDADSPAPAARAADEPSVAAGQSADALEWDLEATESQAPPTIPPETPGSQGTIELAPLPEPAAAAADEAEDVGVEAVGETSGSQGTIELEPIAQPVAETEPPAHDIAEPAAAPQPPREQQQQPPQAPPQPPPGQAPRRPVPVEAFNWGANQEHFFGGMPLNLGGAARPAPQRPPGQAQPAPSAARPPQQPPPQQRQQPQRPMPPQQPPSQFPQRPPQQPQSRTGRPSPFADGGSRVASGFEGLAIPPVNETDVFGQAPGSLTAGFDPSLMSDVFGGGRGGGNNNRPPSGTGAAAGGRAMPTPQPGASAGAGANSNPGVAGAGDAGGAAGRRQPAAPARRATNSEPPGDAWSGSGALAGDVDQTDATPASQRYGAGAQPPLPTADEAPQPTKKKRRWFGLKVLLPFALISMAAAGAAIYQFIPVKSSVTGVLKFANFEKLPKHNRVEFVKPQVALLTDESRSLRDAARRNLAAINKSHSAGFLGDSLEYAKVTSAQQFDVETGTLSLRYVGGAGKADQDRMLALLQALYERNKPLIDEGTELTRTVESLTRERAELERSKKDMEARIEELGVAAQQKPDVAERTKLESEAQQLKQAYEQATANVTRLTSEVKQLRENPPAPAPAPADAPAVPVPAVPAPDAAAAPPAPANELQQLEAQMQKLNEQWAAIQQGRGMTAQAARQKLDMAVESFNQQLQQAQGQIQGNPALREYATAAQEMIKQAREVTEQLIARQQTQFTELAKIKQQLNEKVQARRAEVAARDPELVKLMDHRDFKTRQHNTAVEQGLATEAADLKVQLSALDTEITARQTLVPDDGATAHAIDQLQKLADSTQKNIEADRAAVLQQLAAMQLELAQRQPGNNALTPEQQTVTTEINQRITEVGAAGRQYATSADAANKSADDELRKLEAAGAELAAKIQALAQTTAAITPVAAAPAPPVPAPAAADAAVPAAAVEPPSVLEQKERELATAEKTRADAEAAYFAANKKLHDLKDRTDQARAAGEKRDILVRQRDLAQKNLDQLVNQSELKKRLAEQKAFPVAPTPADLKVDNQGDPRPMYTLIACGAIAALCVGLGFLFSSSGGAAGDSEMMPLYPGQSSEHDPRYAVPYEDEQQEDRPTAVV